MNATVSITPYTPTQKNGQIVCNLLFDELLESVQAVSRAIDHGQKDGVKSPDQIWPETTIGWNCESAIALVIRDLETLKGHSYDLTDLSSRVFQVESALSVIRAVAPESAGYVCRTLDGAIKLAGVAGCLIMDCIAPGKPSSAKIEPEVRRAARRANKEAAHA
ncbi:hypothetical protein E8K88_16545 [Lampropedia aestuarii]|uniref:Uncharacterized protein n=1 Tax=Lampropedia aestuarii TaxID=2562762 RepID=A0A4V3YWD9_9BURK|nr:hypothetical protein [Lampropedia aestuarii]THJ30972.1 hypothetical protein E8K88_16545 [Lampropedia aestuarii]